MSSDSGIDRQSGTPRQTTSPRSATAFIGFLVLTLFLTVTAPERITGDAPEYLALATTMSQGRFPSQTVADGVPYLKVNRSEGDGRQPIWHFWFYPFLAAPFVWLSTRFGLSALWGFRFLNLVLLSATFLVLLRRWGTAAALFVCLGPLLWWVDKAQVEVFTVCGLAVGLALLPRWGAAAVCFAAVATQNPPLIAFVAATGALAWHDHSPGRLPALTWGLAVALSVLHPIFYWRTMARLTPLVWPGDLRIPGIRALLTPLLDLNVGLVANAPLVLVSLVWISGLLLWHAWGRQRPAPELLMAGLGVPWLLASFAQAPNVNSGGTPSMSRYALWLIPLGLPLFSRTAGRARRAATGALAAATVVWTVLYFRPSVAERFLVPTSVAEFVWRQFPSAENPLPEIFAERLRHSDGVNTIAANRDCSKVLIQEGAWPRPCPAIAVPAECRTAGSLCYGNRKPDGTYAFVSISRRGGFRVADIISSLRRFLQTGR